MDLGPCRLLLSNVMVNRILDFFHDVFISFRAVLLLRFLLRGGIYAVLLQFICVLYQTDVLLQ